MQINARTVIARLVMTAAVAVLTASASAQESAAECAGIEDDHERLACFDRVFSDAGDKADPAGASRAAESADGSRHDARSSRAGGAADSTPVRSVEPVPNAAERNRRTAASDTGDRESNGGQQSTEDRFGLEHEVFDLGGEERHSKAIGQFGFWESGQRIELENGQVWQIVDDDELYFKATNPALTIEKGLLGSYYMHLDGISKSIKVKRIR